MNRREFLRDGGLLAAGIAARDFLPRSEITFPLFPHEVEPFLDRGVTKDFALSLWSAGEKVRPFAPDQPKSLEETKRLAQEIAPYYYYEGIHTGKWVWGSFVYDSATTIGDIQIERFDGSQNFHLLGSSYCFRADEQWLQLNDRFFNPYAPWFNKAELVATLAHELGHENGICTRTHDVETAAQLGSIEVLSAMVREGSRYAFLPLMAQLEEISSDWLMLQDLEANNLEGYTQDYVAKLPNPAYQLSAHEKIMKRWEDIGLDQIKNNLEQYGATPYEYLVKALNDPDCLTPEMQSVPNIHHKFEMNSTKYVLRHLRDLTAGYQLLK